MTSLKKRILRGDRLTGGWLSLSSPIAAQIMAEAGYDVLMIDLEHTASDYLSAISLMQAVQAGGGTPVIRCSSADVVDIKRTLDAGPAGIMVPNIRDAAHAREVVAHCRYAPEGDRGAAPGYIRATAYSGNRLLIPACPDQKPIRKWAEAARTPVSSSYSRPAAICAFSPNGRP